MKSLILTLILLVLRIPLDFSPNVGHKSSRFFKTLPKKGFEFVPSRKNNIVAFKLDFMLLPAKINPISEKQGHKRNMLRDCGTSGTEIVFTLLTEVIVLYIRVTMVLVTVLGFKSRIIGCGICLATFLILNK